MPFYNVEHSFPMSMSQKSDLAERITSLHTKAFTTLSMFVQVKFLQQDATAHNYFVGGKHKDENTNRIIGYVRSAPDRKKEHFDKLGQQIEEAWYLVLGELKEGDDGEVKKKDKNDKESTQQVKDAKELLSITFVGGIVAREKGFAIPEAGDEEPWMKQFRKEFEEKADLGDQSFQDMLEEIDTRDDLKNLRGERSFKKDKKEKSEENKKSEEAEKTEAK